MGLAITLLTGILACNVTKLHRWGGKQRSGLFQVGFVGAAFLRCRWACVSRLILSSAGFPVSDLLSNHRHNAFHPQYSGGGGAGDP